MIVVKIELHSAITHRITEIGRMYIWKKDGYHERGDYDVRVMDKGKLDGDPRLEKDVCRSGEVTNYPRLSYNVWRLITRALKSAFPEESK
jgi:hypothetical protein